MEELFLKRKEKRRLTAQYNVVSTRLATELNLRRRNEEQLHADGQDAALQEMAQVRDELTWEFVQLSKETLVRILFNACDVGELQKYNFHRRETETNRQQNCTT